MKFFPFEAWGSYCSRNRKYVGRVISKRRLGADDEETKVTSQGPKWIFHDKHMDRLIIHLPNQKIEDFDK